MAAADGVGGIRAPDGTLRLPIGSSSEEIASEGAADVMNYSQAIS